MATEVTVPDVLGGNKMQCTQHTKDQAGQADWRVEKVVAACLLSLSLMRACFCCSCSRCCRLLCYWDVLLLQMLPMMLIVLDPVVDDIIGLLLC